MAATKTIRKWSHCWAGPALTCAALTLAGCGREAPEAAAGDGAPEQAAVVSDVCAWLSDDEIEGLLSARPTASASSAGLPGCVWTGADRLPLLQATLAPNPASSADDYAARLAAELGEEWSPDELKPVDGLGDFALYTPEARMLQVFRGRRTLQIMVSRPADEAEAMAVARALLGRDW
jgi:hypothetical protein